MRFTALVHFAAALIAMLASVVSADAQPMSEVEALAIRSGRVLGAADHCLQDATPLAPVAQRVFDYLNRAATDVETMVRLTELFATNMRLGRIAAEKGWVQCAVAREALGSFSTSLGD